MDAKERATVATLEYIKQLEAKVAELQAENADLRDELEMLNHTQNF